METLQKCSTEDTQNQGLRFKSPERRNMSPGRQLEKAHELNYIEFINILYCLGFIQSLNVNDLTNQVVLRLWHVLTKYDENKNMYDLINDDEAYQNQRLSLVEEKDEWSSKKREDLKDQKDKVPSLSLFNFLCYL